MRMQEAEAKKLAEVELAFTQTNSATSSTKKEETKTTCGYAPLSKKALPLTTLTSSDGMP